MFYLFKLQPFPFFYFDTFFLGFFCYKFAPTWGLMIYLSFTQPAVVFAVGEIILFDCPRTLCPRASFTLKDKSKIQKSINYQLIVFADLFFLSKPEVFFKLNLGWLLKLLENWLLKTRRSYQESYPRTLQYLAVTLLANTPQRRSLDCIQLKKS